jgi:prophage antirepressor-like protein
MTDKRGEPFFCGKDVATALGYKNPEKALRVHIEDDDKVVNKMDTTYGIKPTTFINESGLYALILSSKLESARKFKRWVTSEVLPSIRKQGGYMVARPDESDEEIMARALQIAHATMQRRGLE